MQAEARAQAGGQSLRDAHARVRTDETLQFAFEPERVPTPPPWSEWVLRLIEALAPFLQYIFWGALALVIGAIAFAVIREIVNRRAPRRIAAAAEPPPVDLTPAPERALALRADADRLAAEGRYAEAVHLLLLRSVADIEALRPATVRPSMTSREIAGLSVLPASALAAFTRVAEVVERSFFGGRAVDADGYSQCRSAYEAFAFPKAWA